MTSPATGTLPYSFAKSNGIIVTANDGTQAEIAVRSNASPRAIAEVRRVLGVPLSAQRLEPAAFEELLAKIYNADDAGAAALAGDLANEMDLSRLLQEIPRVEEIGRAHV